MKRLALACGLILAGCGGDARPRHAEQTERLNASGAEALAAGRARTAAARFTAAADLSAAHADFAGLARDLHNRGLALLAAGEAVAARSDLTESLRLAEEAGLPPAARAATRLALAALLDDPAAAEACVRLAAGEAGEAGASGLQARCQASAAALALRRGDAAAAEAALADAGARAGADPGASGAVAVVRGHVLLTRGDAAAALAAYRRAADDFRSVPDAAGLALALEGAARAAEAGGDREAAARWWRRAADVPHGGEAARGRRLAEAARLGG